METYCNGYKEAKTKDWILGVVNSNISPEKLSERVLRHILSELRREGHVASHNSNPKGYWFIPLHTTDPEEVEAVLRSLKEKRAKALSMLEGINKEIQKQEEKLQNQGLFI